MQFQSAVAAQSCVANLKKIIMAERIYFENQPCDKKLQIEHNKNSSAKCAQSASVENRQWTILIKEV